VITLPLLVGLDGVKKMSKSLGNYIGFRDSSIDMFGKILSISDSLMWNYFELVTDLSLQEIEDRKNAIERRELHPKEVKSELAILIMNQFHPEAENLEAKNEWNKIHNLKNREIPETMEIITLDENNFTHGNPMLIATLTSAKFFSSNGEGIRVLKNGGLYLNEEKLTNEKFSLEKNKTYIVRQGKKGKFLKIET
jgi:tyrosyl-tRNA synthetase